MFPTATLVLAATLAQEVADPVPCDIPGYLVRYKGNIGEGCCTSSGSSGSHCYGYATDEDDYCSISYYYHCCGKDVTIGDGICMPYNQEECQLPFQWCPPPAPPASEELSSGAIGGIVVGAYLGVAGAFGAFGIYRGIAAA